jgi:hypothetical protein
MNSSNPKIVALPVDARPVVRAQVQALAAMAGWTLAMPPIHMLGHFREPADRAALRAWLLHECTGASGVVVSIDMLVYGGLVPSRFIPDGLSVLEANLETLRLLRATMPSMPIYAFAATMRLSNNNVNEEEKPYWDQYGELIWRWSFQEDKAQTLGSADARALADEAKRQIPLAIREDYVATRARNFAVTKNVIDLVREGVVDRLILPQDDTAQYGFNIAERRTLESMISDFGLEQKISVYPGADEVMHTLVAHLVAAQSARAPLRVCFAYADPDDVGALRALYEDRPILDSIAAQFAAVGAVTVTSLANADVLVGVHTSGKQQGDWAMRKPLPKVKSVSAVWLAALRDAQRAKKPIAILDLSYANGGDPALIDALSKAGLPLRTLSAYAGWNTASNSIGSLAAQLTLWHHARGVSTEIDAANLQMTTHRLLEDYLYQAVVRQQIRDVVDERALSAEALRDAVRAHFIPTANAWLVKEALPVRVTDIDLPWQRTFEIDLELSAGVCVEGVVTA